MTVTVDPYYQDELVTIYHGDWRYAWAALDGESTAVTDPPYGIGYESGMPSATIARSIVGDRDTTERDTFLTTVPLWCSGRGVHRAPTAHECCWCGTPKALSAWGT